MNADVLARDFIDVVLISATSLTEIRIALAHCQVAWALLGVALGLASAPGESVLTLAAALTKLFAEVLRLDARTRGVALSIWMVAWREVVHVIRPYKYFFFFS